MEFIRYICKVDLDEFKNHGKTLGDLVKDSYHEKSEVEEDSNLPDKARDAYCSNIPITITIEDSDITILNAAIPTILSMENVINDSI